MNLEIILTEGRLLEASIDKLHEYKREYNDLESGLDNFVRFDNVTVIRSDRFKSIGVVKGKYYSLNKIKELANYRLAELDELIEALEEKIYSSRAILADKLVSSTSEKECREALMTNMNIINDLNSTIAQLRRDLDAMPDCIETIVPSTIVPFTKYYLVNGIPKAPTALVKATGTELYKKYSDEVKRKTSENNILRGLIKIFDVISDGEDEYEIPFVAGGNEESLMRDIYDDEVSHEAINRIRNILDL